MRLVLNCDKVLLVAMDDECTSFQLSAGQLMWLH